MATNKIASYQRLVEDINVKLNSAARVNTDAERQVDATLKKIDADAQSQRKQAVAQRQEAQSEYRKIADMLASDAYQSVNVRIPPMVRPINTSTDISVLAAKQRNISGQIVSLLSAFGRQQKAEAEAAAAQAVAAARARAAAAEALARRRATMNKPVPTPKKKPNIALIVGIAIGVAVVLGIAVAAVLQI